MEDNSALLAQVSADLLRQNVYYLSHKPFSRRVYNWSLPCHPSSSLDEADSWIAQQLMGWGYTPEYDQTQVRAFGRDTTKPLAQQYASPPADAPWFTAQNVLAKKLGTDNPEQLIVVLAHKDSQSWIASPGANDNAIGTCGALEAARVLRGYKPKHSLWFIFCNEEHIPWTSVTAALAIKAAGLDVLAAINLDGIGVKSPDHAGQLTNVTRYTSDEGERLADMMARLNEQHSLGLLQSKYRSARPGDDDGSFINAGFPWAVLNTGSIPYGDPNYHSEGDTADLVDVANAKVTVQLTLAAILHLDAYGRP
ncbi:MAG: M28 family metallopeptidase [Anaerolineae bacterium]